ncbi:hypothetical protein BJY01DRAFT_218526 [Aspergillus pseudoustus]|uniref:Uncharacterized protein n=1 Tax=Aspergillus pseudoustus TaxID=1810923 RepID=A0ABR4JMU3_9EURO
MLRSSPAVKVEIRTPPGCSSPSRNAPATMEVIDEGGDMIITFSRASFLAFSKALSLASPCFAPNSKRTSCTSCPSEPVRASSDSQTNIKTYS